MTEPDYERIGRAVIAVLDKLEELGPDGTPPAMLDALRSGMGAIADAIPKDRMRAAGRALDAMGSRMTWEERSRLAEHGATMDRAVELLEGSRA